MARRRRTEDHRNHEAWAIPYGDLVTLLMAFFVVMYAVSVVDAGKYRVLSSSMVEAFGARVAVEPIQVGEPSLPAGLISDDVYRSLVPLDVPLSGGVEIPLALTDAAKLSPSDVALQSVLESAPSDQQDAVLAEISEMSQEVEAAFASLIEDGDLEVRRQPFWLELTINTRLLFTSGSATLEPGARPVLASVARLLAKRDARVHVEGHTDDRPISNSIYPSNWELSSGRAASVVNLFAQHGVNPRRMVAIGYGEFEPKASNLTEDGRAQNRRVEVIVLPGPPRAEASTSRVTERLQIDSATVP